MKGKVTRQDTLPLPHPDLRGAQSKAWHSKPRIDLSVGLGKHFKFV